MSGFIKVFQRPIYVVGLPRSGTTWVASVLNTAKGIKYFHEPFNYKTVPNAASHFMEYLRATNDNPKFARHWHDALSGRTKGHHVNKRLLWPYKRFRWWPGRVVIKDINTCMALAWTYQHIRPHIIIVMRHPCGVASSWFRMNWTEIRGIQRLLNQSRLMEDYLNPFEYLLKGAQDFWQKIGAYWGAVYYVMLQQQQKQPHWIVIQHEKLCRDSIGQYRKLFSELNLSWTAETDNMLNTSTKRHSNLPYVPERISSQEPDKWKAEMNHWQIEYVREFVKPFRIDAYHDF